MAARASKGMLQVCQRAPVTADLADQDETAFQGPDDQAQGKEEDQKRFPTQGEGAKQHRKKNRSKKSGKPTRFFRKFPKPRFIMETNPAINPVPNAKMLEIEEKSLYIMPQS